MKQTVIRMGVARDKSMEELHASNEEVGRGFSITVGIIDASSFTFITQGDFGTFKLGKILSFSVVVMFVHTFSLIET